MKYRFSAWWCRLLAYVLAAVCLAGAFVSGLGVCYSGIQGQYSEDEAFQTTWICRSWADYTADRVVQRFRNGAAYNNWDRLLENSNLRFIILEEATGDVVASYLDGLSMKTPKNLKDNIYLYEYNANFSLGEPDTIYENLYVADLYFGVDWISRSSEWQYWEEMTTDEELDAQLESYQMLLLLPDTFQKQGSGDELYASYQMYQEFLAKRYIAPPVLVVCMILLTACVIFLLCQAGHRPGEEALWLIWWDRIALELPLAVGILAFLGAAASVLTVYDGVCSGSVTANTVWMLCILLMTATVVCGVICIIVCETCAVRVKQGKWWNGLLVWRAVHWCIRLLARGVQWLWNTVKRSVLSLHMVPRVAVAVLGAMILDGLLVYLVVATEEGSVFLMFLGYNLLLVLAVLWAVAQMHILHEGAKALADGDLEKQVNTEKMYWDFKQHGNYLNAISGGMAKAVEKQMRSERLKTELITNVSHDIKTPLTSIVNYVDLLQRPHDEKQQKEYLEVLERQAGRLKRLTENLVEASKASTGNIAVNLEKNNVMELVTQAVEEYRDRMEAGKLEVVMSLRGDLSVMADGKLMWRILDNLLNNVVKYALAGTRVYVTAQRWDDRVVIAVKNISRDPLNVDADELMERFVRGDASRHTEGSGLGLNIARSLTELQKGSFALTVDGDLFKAEVSMPSV